MDHQSAMVKKLEYLSLWRLKFFSDSFKFFRRVGLELRFLRVGLFTSRILRNHFNLSHSVHTHQYCIIQEQGKQISDQYFIVFSFTDFIDLYHQA